MKVVLDMGSTVELATVWREEIPSRMNYSFQGVKELHILRFSSY
jgi:hypothetical protein